MIKSPADNGEVNTVFVKVFDPTEIEVAFADTSEFRVVYAFTTVVPETV
jgi:hypothetical protein